jgi:heme oxygenase
MSLPWRFRAAGVPAIIGRLGVTSEHGGRYFHGYGEQTISSWNEFMTFAERTCPDAVQREKAALDDYTARAEKNPRSRT